MKSRTVLGERVGEPSVFPGYEFPTPSLLWSALGLPFSLVLKAAGWTPVDLFVDYEALGPPMCSHGRYTGHVSCNGTFNEIPGKNATCIFNEHMVL